MLISRRSSEARRNFKVSPAAALKPYLRLQNLAGMLKKAQVAAEDAAPHLIDHVDKTIQTLWQQMKDAFAGDFEATLTKMKWPGKDVRFEGILEHDWREGVEKLLDLQEPCVNISFFLNYRYYIFQPIFRDSSWVVNIKACQEEISPMIAKNAWYSTYQVPFGLHNLIPCALFYGF